MKRQLSILALVTPLACGGGDDDLLDPPVDDPGAELPGDTGDEGGDDGGDVTPTVGPCTLRTEVYGVTAVLHDASGSILETGTTGSDGSIEWDACPQNAMVSFADYSEYLGAWRGVTVAGVQPFDDIGVRLNQVGWQGTLMTDVPEDGADIDYPNLSAGSNCYASTAEGASQELPITADCLGDDRNTLAVLATGKIGEVWVYSHSDDVPFNKNGVTNIDLEHMTNWMSGGQVALSAINAPGGLVSFQMEYMRNGLSYRKSSWAASVTDGEADRVIPVPPSSFSTLRRVGAMTNGTTRSGEIRLSSDPAVEFDLAGRMADIGGGEADVSDPLRPILSATDLPAEGDLGLFRLRWTVEGEEVVWRVIFPSKDMSSVTFPELPESLGEVMPADEFTFQEIYVINMTGSDYQQILTSGYTIWGHQQNCGEVTFESSCRFSYHHL